MKRLKTLFILMTAVSCTSCATLNVQNLSRVKQTALISVYCDRNIDMSDFTGLAAVVARFAQSDQFDLRPVATKIKNNMLGKYAIAFPFKFLPEELVVNRPGYIQMKQTFSNQFGDAVYRQAPEGYTSIVYDNATDYQMVLSQLPEADAAMVIASNYKLAKTGEFLGFGSARMKNELVLVARNRQDEMVFRVRFIGESKNDVKFALGGVFDAAPLPAMCVEATEDALMQFDRWLRENMYKFRLNSGMTSEQAFAQTVTNAAPPAAAAVAPPSTTATPPQNAFTPAIETKDRFAAERTSPFAQTADEIPALPSPPAPNRVQHRMAIYGAFGENQFILEDFNRTTIHSYNAMLAWLKTTGFQVNPMEEIKSVVGLAEGIEIGITDWLLVGGEVNHLFVYRQGRAWYETGSMTVNLDLPTTTYGTHVKLAGRLGERLLLTVGLGVEYLTLDGKWSVKNEIDGLQVYYDEETFAGAGLGYQAMLGAEIFLSRQIVFDLDLGYRNTLLREVYYENGDRVRLPDGNPMQLQYEGLIFRGGLKWYIL